MTTRPFDNEDEETPDRWFSGVEGIVAVNEDPKRRGRVKVIIPLVSEEEVYDVWARRVQLFVGGPGYGDFHPPELNTEVVLWGRMGDPYNLFYAPLYNEDFPVPSEFQDTAVRGLRTDGDYLLIVDGDLFLRAGRIVMESSSTIRITAPAGVFINGKKY